MTTALRYTVLAGDTLSSIASGLNASAGVGVQAIEQANPGVNPNALAIGMVLNIPARTGSATALRYTVLAGDSYSKIASELSACAGMTYPAIQAANPGIDPNTLAVGQVIAIPDISSPVPVDPVTDAETIGFWWWTWSPANAAPAGTNLGIAFSGWSDQAQALSSSATIKDRLPGGKFISVGGGKPETGSFTSANLASLTAAINAGAFAGYDGIAYDIEEGETGLETLFQQSFAAAQAQGFKVLVTVSHSAPYGINDAASLMQSFFADANINFLSPQLYTNGDETSNDYTTSGGVLWQQYAGAKAAVIPSIVNADMYQSAKTYFQQQGVTITGFVQWSQSA
ncbi:MAG: LysM domain-containing protein [Sulfuricellaceae bacterium]